MTLISRFVPGVLNNEESSQFESMQDNLLEYPHYTRPEEWNGKKVPKVLLTGDHSKIEAWRLKQSVKRTKERRPDLLSKKQTCDSGIFQSHRGYEKGHRTAYELSDPESGVSGLDQKEIPKTEACI